MELQEMKGKITRLQNRVLNFTVQFPVPEMSLSCILQPHRPILFSNLYSSTTWHTFLQTQLSAWSLLNCQLTMQNLFRVLKHCIIICLAPYSFTLG